MSHLKENTTEGDDEWWYDRESLGNTHQTSEEEQMFGRETKNKKNKSWY